METVQLVSCSNNLTQDGEPGDVQEWLRNYGKVPGQGISARPIRERAKEDKARPRPQKSAKARPAPQDLLCLVAETPFDRANNAIGCPFLFAFWVCDQ